MQNIGFARPVSRARETGKESKMFPTPVFCFALLVVLLRFSAICAGQAIHEPTVLKGAVSDSAGAAIVNASIVLEDSRSRSIATPQVTKPDNML